MMTINSTLDAETATMIAREFGADVQMRSFEEELTEVETESVEAGGSSSRARRSSPSWATSTTARRRCSTRSAKTRVAEREAGGITQHIGAYHVTSTAATSCSSTRRATRRSR